MTQRSVVRSLDEFDRRYLPHTRAKRLHDEAMRQDPATHIARAISDRLFNPKRACPICTEPVRRRKGDR